MLDKVGAYINNQIREFAYVYKSNSGEFLICKEKQILTRMCFFKK